MSMNYLTYGIRVANLLPVNLSNTQFQNMLPSMIEYAELRIYRELNLLETRVANSTLSTSANTRNFTLPVPAAGPYVTVVGINVILPANTSLANGGTRKSIPSRSRMLVDFMCPSDVGASVFVVPEMYYMRDQNTVIIGPASQTSYFVEVVGTIRPNPLSATNPTTFLTQYFPDLFTAASMVFAGNYLRDFGQEAGGANIAQGWEQQYQSLFAGANNEETRKRYNDEVNKQ
jgi:hypothetical protein